MQWETTQLSLVEKLTSWLGELERVLGDGDQLGVVLVQE